MNLDPRTLLFSLILTNALMLLCLLVAVVSRDGKPYDRRDGMRKWTLAVFLEMMVWVAGDLRGILPAGLVVIVAHGFKAASHAMILAAISEFQRRRVPNWQYSLPIAAAVLVSAILIDDVAGRFVWDGLIFGLQLALVARALLTDRGARSGRAWRLLFAGIAMLMMVLGLRVLAALSGHAEFAQITNAVSPHPVQIVSFVAIMATSLLGSMGFILMVKERADREIMQLAMTDSLTHLPNRRALMERAEQLLARRSGAPLALMMIDVDRFKLINDNYGHPAGDEVLRKTAELLSNRLRTQDLLGRYGGEEFCAIVPETDRDGAQMLAESLRAAIFNAPFVTESGALSISISIGVALCAERDSRALKDMLVEADSALYSAKQAGRNRVVCFGAHPANLNVPS